MHNKMRKIIPFLIVTMFLIACNPKVYNTIDTSVFGSMFNGMDGRYSTVQLDSMIKADKLPKIDRWYPSSFRDFETNAIINIYTYYTDNDSVSTVYRVEEISSDSVTIVKRVTVKEAEE